MHQQFLNDDDDILWLELKSWFPADQIGKTESFIITGNEDAPDRVECYDTLDPFMDDKPFLVLKPNED